MTAPRHGHAPLAINETAGTRAYRWCGLSAKLPYCDGTHSVEGTGVGPGVVVVAEPGRKAICQCHQTSSRPWCDGTHARLR